MENHFHRWRLSLLCIQVMTIISARRTTSGSASTKQPRPMIATKSTQYFGQMKILSNVSRVDLQCSYIGACATYDEDTRILSILPWCSYFQYGAYNVTIPGYIQLPTILTELNDYMCGPLHRKGLVCSECADGFGPSLTSEWQRCANCSGVWYGVPLVLLIEIIPVTVLYFVVLAFQIRLTVPPMPCLIMYALLCRIAFDAFHPIGKLVPMYETKDGRLRLLDSNIVVLLCDMFSLDFFIHVLPPFCISSKLNFYHVTLFGYVSVFYPIFLIFLTWLFVELHGRNYRLLRWLWKPFQLCIARIRKQGIDTKNDLIDVFATFFLLSYHKCLYQTQMYYGAFPVNIDPSGNYSSLYKGSVIGSFTINGFLIATMCVASFFCLLPPILLTCYPFKFFRSCLSKCHMDTITINTFVENYHGYYRNGLDGGRDMRSLSGFYFFMVVGMCLLPLFYFYTNKDFFPLRNSGIATSLVALALALMRPYKKTYANVLDTLILADFSLLCLYSDYNCNKRNSPFIESLPVRILVAGPLAVFIVVLLLRMVYKVFQMCNIKGSPCYKPLCARFCSRRASYEEMDETSALMAAADERPLIKFS